MTGPVAPVTVIEALLLRTKLPDLHLRQGSSFVARVASRGEGGAAGLVIAGELINARVPEEVKAGQTLRLSVAEITAERITLRMEPAPGAQAAAAQPPSPGAPRVTVEERPGGGGGRRGGESAVTLTYETATLGTLRVRVATAPGAVSATVQVPAPVLDAARARAERLRENLAAQTGRAASVHVLPGSVDVRA